MRRPEVITSLVCGHARVVKVCSEANRAQARNCQCQDCRKYGGDPPFEPVTTPVVCPVCQRPRLIHASQATRITDAERRPCKSCAKRARDDADR